MDALGFDDMNRLARPPLLCCGFLASFTYDGWIESFAMEMSSSMDQQFSDSSLSGFRVGSYRGKQIGSSRNEIRALFRIKRTHMAESPESTYREAIGITKSGLSLILKNGISRENLLHLLSLLVWQRKAGELLE